jgi:hypothetical protein
MVMSDDPTQTLPRIRTFAQDFEHDRKESGVTLPPGVSAPAPLPDDHKKPGDTSIKITDATKKPPMVAVKSRVPAFHELQKSAHPEHITVPTPKQEPHHTPEKNASVHKPEATTKTVLVRNTKPVNESARPAVSSATASIITDTKRAEFSFFSHLSNSIQKWFKSITTKKVTTPKYTVIDSERRKGVIQKATTKSGAIFTADNETLQEEIRRRTLKQPHPINHTPDIIWSPNTEPGYALLDSSVEPVLVSTPPPPQIPNTPVPVPAPQPPLTTPVIPPPVFVEPTVPDVPQPLPTPTPQVPPVPAPQPPLTTPVIPPPVFVEPTVPDVPPPTEPSEEEYPPEMPPQEYTLTTPEAHYRIRSIGDVTKLNTNILSVGVVGIVAAIIILVILLRMLFGFVFNAEPTVEIPPATPFAQATAVTDVALSTPTQEALIIALQQITPHPGVTTEFRIVDSSGVPIPMQQLLPLLGLPNSGSLNRSITDAHILYIGNIRSVILTVTDATTAFGSLLSWEGSMVQALGPVLNIPPTSDAILVTDRTISNSDARLFKAGEQELLIYGFVKSNTVLITKDTAAFSTALGIRP